MIEIRTCLQNNSFHYVSNLQYSIRDGNGFVLKVDKKNHAYQEFRHRYDLDKRMETKGRLNYFERIIERQYKGINRIQFEIHEKAEGDHNPLPEIVFSKTTNNGNQVKTLENGGIQLIYPKEMENRVTSFFMLAHLEEE